jgi:hypothetical protein
MLSMSFHPITNMEPHKLKRANPYFSKKIPLKMIILKETDVYILQN